MDKFFRQHPLAIACGIGGAAIATWLFNSWILIILGLIVGAFIGFKLDSRRT